MDDEQDPEEQQSVDEERESAESERRPEPVRAAPRPAPVQAPPAAPARPGIFYNQLGDEIPEGSAYAAGHEPTAMQRFHGQQAQLWAQLPVGMKQQVMLDQIRLSQHEQISLQRLQNQMGAVDANPYLTEEEKAHLKTQIQTKINPWTLRAAKAKAIQQQIATQQLQAQVQQMAALQTAAANERAKNFDKEVAVSGRQGGLGDVHMVFNPHTGTWYDPFEKERDLHAKLQEARLKHEADAKVKAEEMELKHYEHDTKFFADIYARHHKQVGAELEPKEGGDDTGSLVGGSAAPKHHDETVNRVRAELNTKAASAHDYAEERAAARKAKGAAPGQPAVPPNVAPPNAPAAPPPTAPNAKPFAVHPVEGENPFAEHRLDRSALDGPQKKMVGVLDSVRRRVEDKSFPTTKLKDEHIADVDDMLRVLGQYGHPDAMPADQLARWKKQLAYWNRLGVLER